MTAERYIGWAAANLAGARRFRPLAEEFPESHARLAGFESALVAHRAGRWFPFGAAVVVAFKRADAMTLAEIGADMNRLLRVAERPGHLDVFETYAALVLVFERPLAAAKRDHLVSMRRTARLGRCAVDLVVVDLEAGAVWHDQVPWLARRDLPALHDALSRAGDPPAREPAPAAAGERSRRAPVSLVGLSLAAVLVGLHVAVHVSGDASTPYRLFRAGADHAWFVARGEPWRLVTSIFLHWDWRHLVLNLFFLFEFVRGTEFLFGAGWTAALFVLTGIGGNLLQNLILPPACGVGASGAMFGLAGAMAGVYLTRGGRVSVRYRGYLFMAFVWALYQVYRTATSFAPGIAHWAHLGGFVTGAAIGAALPFRAEGGSGPWGGRWWGSAALAVALGSAVLAAANRERPVGEFVRVRDESARLEYEMPAAWIRREAGEGVTVVNSGLGGGVVLRAGPDRADALLRMSERELGRWALDAYRDRYERTAVGETAEWRRELDGLEVSRVPFAGGEAVRVRFASRLLRYDAILGFSSVAGETLHEEYVLPHRRGHLVAAMRHPAGDRAYYAPVLARFRSSASLLAEPVRAGKRGRMKGSAW